MLLPIALIVAVHAVEREVSSARPQAPVLAERPGHRFLRTRTALSRALYATARFVAAEEQRPSVAVPRGLARCATGTL